MADQAMPEILKPLKGRYRIADLGKIFCADVTHDDDIFELRGIDRAVGCIVIVRPDQYVAHVLPHHAHKELCAFFSGVLLPQR